MWDINSEFWDINLELQEKSIEEYKSITIYISLFWGKIWIVR